MLLDNHNKDSVLAWVIVAECSVQSWRNGEDPALSLSKGQVRTRTLVVVVRAGEKPALTG